MFRKNEKRLTIGVVCWSQRRDRSKSVTVRDAIRIVKDERIGRLAAKKQPSFRNSERCVRNKHRNVRSKLSAASESRERAQSCAPIKRPRDRSVYAKTNWNSPDSLHLRDHLNGKASSRAPFRPKTCIMQAQVCGNLIKNLTKDDI